MRGDTRPIELQQAIDEAMSLPELVAKLLSVTVAARLDTLRPLVPENRFDAAAYVQWRDAVEAHPETALMRRLGSGVL